MFLGGGLLGVGLDLLDIFQSLMDTFTDQQKEVLDFFKRKYDALDRANDVLDQKSLSILSTSGTIAGLVGAFSIFGGNLTGWKELFFAGTIAFFCAIAFISHRIWKSTTFLTAGTDDWEHVYDSYVQATVEDAFSQLLSDQIKAHESVKGINGHKSQWFRYQSVALIVQAVLLLLALIS